MQIVNPAVVDSIKTFEGNLMSVSVLEIGGWDMDADSYTTVTTPSWMSSIIPCGQLITIVDDTETTFHTFNNTNFNPGDLTSFHVPASNYIRIERVFGCGLDSVNFDDDTINRGYVTLFYLSA